MGLQTAEIAALEAKLARGGEGSIARELALFTDFAARAAGSEVGIRAAAEALAALDVAAGLAEWAEETQATRPEVALDRSTLTPR